MSTATLTRTRSAKARNQPRGPGGKFARKPVDPAAERIQKMRHSVLVEPVRAKVPALGVAGRSGLKYTGGRIQEELLPALKSDLHVKVYKEMADNNPLVAGALLTMETLVRQASWSFEACDEEPEAGEPDRRTELADFYEGARTDMESRWDDFISEVMSMPQFGWALFEVLLKLRKGPHAADKIMRSEFTDGRWGWRDFAIRSQDSRYEWLWDHEGTPTHMVQRIEGDPASYLVPLEKCMLFRIQARKGNPEGRSWLRGVYRSHWFMKRLEELEAIGLDRDLTGLPVGKVPAEWLSAGATADQSAMVTALREILEKVRADTISGLIWPSEFNPDGTNSGFGIDLMASSGKQHGASDVAIKRHRSDLMVGLLSEVLMLGQNNVGSWALASEQTALLVMALAGLLESIADVVTARAVPMIGNLNRFPRRQLPKLQFGDIEKPDVLKLAQSLQALVTSGILTPDNELEIWTRDTAGMPPREKPDAARALPANLAPEEQVLLGESGEPAPEGAGPAQLDLGLPAAA